MHNRSLNCTLSRLVGCVRVQKAYGMHDTHHVIIMLRRTAASLHRVAYCKQHLKPCNIGAVLQIRRIGIAIFYRHVIMCAHTWLHI